MQQIRLRQRRLKRLLLGFVPFVLAAAYISYAPSAGLKTLFVAAAAVYGLLLLVCSFRLAFMECPRCEGYYHCNWWLDPWAQRCLHCGLSLRSAA